MNLSTCIKGLLPATALLLSLGAQAGNIPQYSFSESRDSEFQFLTDAIPVVNAYKEANEMVYPDRQVITAYTGQGFPIGFDFKYGGQVFNQFAIDNSGTILLGYDKVVFRGYCNLFFHDASRYAQNSFFMGLTPNMFGIKEGELSYKLEGTEGDRRLTVQFAHMNVREPQIRGNAIYSMQIVLFEKTGEVKINFLEEESPYTNLGLYAGLLGWSNDDCILLTSKGLDSEATISPERYAEMLNGSTMLRWTADDALGWEHDDPYQFSFSFTPTGGPDFQCAAPTELTVEQVNDKAIVSCKRSADAPATVILFSETPIEEFPQQGVTYPVLDYSDEYATTFGGATMIYYDNAENPVAEVPNIKPSTRYYVKAFGVNGYPSYSTDSSADMEFFSSHPAPYIIQASSADKAINIHTVGDDDIIIAMTLDRVNTSSEGATGIFGFPEADCKVGDKLAGGGEVIYIGAPGDFVYTDAVPNRQNFFRAWGVREGRVSKTSINASGVTNPEMPYEPMIELYTLYQPPLNWVDQTTSTATTVTAEFVPRMHGADEDEPAVCGYSLMGTTSTLISPSLQYGEGAKLSFEWAMETIREVEQGDAMVVLPEGNEPGVFGAGHSFQVAYGPRGTENTLFTATNYTGTMTPSPLDPDKYLTGSSTWLPVEVDLPAATKARISFRFSTEGSSMLYLRKILVTDNEHQVGISEAFMQGSEDMISGAEGCLSILSANGGEYNVYSLDGRRIASPKLNAGEGCVVAAEKGIYVVNGAKIVVK